MNFGKIACAAFLASLPAAAASAEGLTRTPWQMQMSPSIKVGDRKIAPRITANSPPEVQKAFFESVFLPSDLAEIPAADKGWSATPKVDTIGFGSLKSSRLPNGVCYTNGVDFTYFQTFVDVPENMAVNEFSIRFTGAMDDVALIVLYPAGSDAPQIVEGSYVLHSRPGSANPGTTADLASLVRPGRNRVVILQADLCPTGNILESAEVSLNGATIETQPVAAIPSLASLQSCSVGGAACTNDLTRGYFMSERAGARGAILLHEGSGDRPVLHVEHLQLPDGKSAVAFRNDQGRYLRVDAGKNHEANFTAESSDAPETRFAIAAALDSPDRDFASFTSVAFPDRYLRHQGYILFAHPTNNTPLFNRDASWRIVDAR